MSLPNPNAVRIAYSEFLIQYNTFISFLEENEDIAFIDYYSYLSSTRIKLSEIWHNINLLTIVDRKYSKAFEKLKKNIILLTMEPDNIGKKYTHHNVLVGTDWEFEYKKGRLRKELIKFFKKVSKELNKINNILN